MTMRRARGAGPTPEAPVPSGSPPASRTTPDVAANGAVQMRPKKLSLSPVYRHLRDSITRPHLRLTESRYFWERWKPRLGPDATILVMEVRDRCNRSLASVDGTDGSGGDCTVGANELAAACGFSRVTLWRILQREEVKRFVWVEHNYVYDQAMGKKRRTISTYHVLMEDPLVEEDEAYVQSLIEASAAPTVQAATLVESDGLSVVASTPRPRLQLETEVSAPTVQPATTRVPFSLKPVNVHETNQEKRLEGTLRGGVTAIGDVVKQGASMDPKAFVASLLARDPLAQPRSAGALRTSSSPPAFTPSPLADENGGKPVQFVPPDAAHRPDARRRSAEKYPELVPFIDHAERMLGDRHSRGFYVTALRRLHPDHMHVWYRALGLASEQAPETIRRSRGALFASLLRTFAAAAGVTLSSPRAGGT